MPRIKDTGDPKKNAEQINKAYKKREKARLIYIANQAYARRWMASKSQKPASFLWICWCLDLDPDILRYIAANHDKVDELVNKSTLTGIRDFVKTAKKDFNLNKWRLQR